MSVQLQLEPSVDTSLKHSLSVAECSERAALRVTDILEGPGIHISKQILTFEIDTIRGELH
jgi:hypothetical protein